MAREFDNNSANYLEVSSVPVSAMPLSMACWFICDQNTANDTMISIADTSSSNDWWIMNMRGADAGDPLTAWSQAGATARYAATTTGITVGQWHHGVAVFTNSTSRAAYIDGGSKGTNTNSSSPTMATPRLSIGRVGDSTPSSEFDGKIAEVAIWNVALTDADALSLSKGISPLFVRPEGLVYYAPLLGNYSPEIDLVGSLNITINGTVPKYTHPRIIYPTIDEIGKMATAAVTTAVKDLIMAGMIAFPRS